MHLEGTIIYTLNGMIGRERPKVKCDQDLALYWENHRHDFENYNINELGRIIDCLSKYNFDPIGINKALRYSLAVRAAKRQYMMSKYAQEIIPNDEDLDKNISGCIGLLFIKVKEEINPYE